MILTVSGSVKNGCSFYNGPMPRVSAEHLAARRQQILDAAWRCFARQGFHATSMQDVFAESGLSAGAVYRYFPSKADLVRNIAEAILGRVSQIFDDMTAGGRTPKPDEAIRKTLHVINEMAETGRTRVALHVWSESLHDDDIKQMVHRVAFEFRRKWELLAEHWKASGDIAPDSSPEDVAATLYGVLIGFITQLHILGDVDPDRYADGLASLLGRSVPEVAGRDT